MKRFPVILVAAAASVCLLFTGCSKIADNTEHFDDITKTLKLTKSYEGKTLMSDDGIGTAQLVGDTTDGDTSNFSMTDGSGDYITVRYEGVDTPESTGGVEKWGKAASLFTNERLHMATEIVIESASGGKPEKDSVSGVRLMCYVWYKTEKDDFKLLNLELVENGYSYNKADATSAYYGYFQKAEQFARSIELRTFSKLDDPLYDTSAQELSLKTINEQPDTFKDNTKVWLYAYVTERYTASSGAVTFTIAQYDEATHKAYSLKLYAGHTNSTSNMTVGNLYHILGTLQKYDGNWQISGVTLDNDAKGQEDATWISQRSYFLTFDSSKLHAPNGYGDVTVTSATLSGSTLTIVGTAPDAGGDPEEFTFTVEVPEDYSGAIEEGSTLTISGSYQFVVDSHELTIPSYSNISIK